MQYFSLKVLLIGGRISFVGVIDTLENRQRLGIKARNPSALLDVSGSTGCLGGMILAN